MAWSVVQRTREIGIRLALGAQPPQVMSMMLMDGLRLVAGGLAAGVLLALVVTRVFVDWLFGVRPADMASYVAAGTLLTAVMLLASWIPARRTLRVDPARSLRWE